MPVVAFMLFMLIILGCLFAIKEPPAFAGIVVGGIALGFAWRRRRGKPIAR